jgi:hypothetical protein
MQTVTEAMRRRIGTGIMSQSALPILAGFSGRASLMLFLATTESAASRARQMRDSRKPRKLYTYGSVCMSSQPVNTL